MDVRYRRIGMGIFLSFQGYSGGECDPTSLLFLFPFSTVLFIWYSPPLSLSYIHVFDSLMRHVFQSLYDTHH